MAGDQVPKIPLVEVVGKGAKVSPAQIGATAAKLGVIIGLTVIVNVCDEKQAPPFGVKV